MVPQGFRVRPLQVDYNVVPKSGSSYLSFHRSWSQLRGGFGLGPRM